MKLRYIGPHDGVDVPLPGGSAIVTVLRGAVAEFDPDHAAGLLEQEINWEDGHRTGHDKKKASKADTTPAPDAPAEKEA